MLLVEDFDCDFTAAEILRYRRQNHHGMFGCHEADINATYLQVGREKSLAARRGRCEQHRYHGNHQHHGPGDEM